MVLREVNQATEVRSKEIKQEFQDKMGPVLQKSIDKLDEIGKLGIGNGITK